MKLKLLKENSLVISGIFYSIISLILMYILFASCILGVIFFVLWNIGISPVFGIAKIDIVASCLITLSIFSIFNFAHINILKENKKREGTLRYQRYNLLLNVFLKIFIYLFTSIPFIILWNYAIPNNFSLNLLKINLFQTILFIISIRFIFGMILYSISKDVTSNRIANNIGEIFIDWLNAIYPEGTYNISNEFVNEKAEFLNYIENYCKEHALAYRLGYTSTEYVAILYYEDKKETLKQINAVIFKDEENTDWYKFCDLGDGDIKDLDIIEFNIYECGSRLVN